MYYAYMHTNYIRFFQNHSILLFFLLFPKTISELLLLTVPYLLLRNCERQPSMSQMSSLFFWKYSVVVRFQTITQLKIYQNSKYHIFVTFPPCSEHLISCGFLEHVTTLKIEFAHPMSKMRNNIVGFKWLFIWVITNKMQKGRTTECLKVLYKLYI